MSGCFFLKHGVLYGLFGFALSFVPAAMIKNSDKLMTSIAFFVKVHVD